MCYPWPLTHFLVPDFSMARKEHNTHKRQWKSIGVEIKQPKRKEIMEQTISEYIMTKTFSNLKMSINATNHKDIK